MSWIAQWRGIAQAAALLLRRLVAFSVDVVVAVAFCGAVVYADYRWEILAGYDGAQMGSVALLLSFVVSEGVFGSTPGKMMMGLRLRSAVPGGEAVAIRRMGRAFLFWVFVTAPSAVYSMDWFATVIGQRKAALLGVSTIYAIMVSAAISPVTNRFGIGLHDVLSGTQVRRAGHKVAAPHMGEVLRSHLRLFCSVWVILCLLVLGIEWRYNASEEVSRFMQSRVDAMKNAATSSETRAYVGMDAMMSYGPTEWYYNEDTDPPIVLRGRAEYFLVPVPRRVLGDPKKEFAAAYDAWIDVVGGVSPSTRWIEFELVSYRVCGPLVVKFVQRMLGDQKSYRMRYAPSREVQHGDSVTTFFEPKVSREVQVTTGSWSPSSFSVAKTAKALTAKHVSRSVLGP